jgi:hypothetical protein
MFTYAFRQVTLQYHAHPTELTSIPMPQVEGQYIKVIARLED